MDNDRIRGRRDLCADIREDDGIDPREDRRSAARAGQPNWKDDQVASLTRRAVEGYLASRQDSLAWTLRVREVNVEARGSSLRVLIEWSGQQLYGVVQRWLDQHAAGVRAEVALAVRRKRAPSVRLVAAGPEAPRPGDREIQEDRR